MKLWTKRGLALLLTVLMLVAMIPAGVFTAQAGTLSLDNYATQTEFVINDTADWATVAASSHSFFGKTVKLGANINAGGATLATLFDGFKGTFDGQGYTVSNFKATTALIATTTSAGAVIQNLNVNGTVSNSQDTTQTGILIGSHDGTGSLTVRNCNVAGSASSVGMHFGGVIGILTLNDGQSALIENINVSATLTDTRSSTSNACVSAGGVVGIFEPFGRPTLVIKNVNMTGSITASRKSVGGVLGSVFTSDKDEDLYAGGMITISNASMTGSLRAATTNTVTGIGGIVGTFGGFKRAFGDYTAFDGELNIDNCVVGGSIANTNGLTQPMSVGGVLGSISYSHATVNVEHCLIKAAFPSQSLTAANGTGAGLILGTGACQTMSALNVDNTVTTIQSFNLIGSVVAKEGKQAAWLVLNGKNCSSVSANYEFGPWYYSGPITDSSVLTVTAEAAAAMVKKDENGFVKKIGGQIAVVGVQDTVSDGAMLTAADKYSVRFIAVTHAESAIEGRMNVIVREADTGRAVRSFTSDARLYDGLTAYQDNGSVIKSYEAKDFGGKKFIALIVGNIPAGQGYVFEITPQYTTTAGVQMTGETVSVTYDENGQYIKAKESLDVEEFVNADTVRVMSSNILAADNAMYNLDNKRNDTGEVYDPSLDKGKSDTTIYKNGQTYYWYFRDDVNGEYIGRVDGVAGTGLSHEERLSNMATMFLFYHPDFIGLQEMLGTTSVNGHTTINMQEVLLGYMGEKYAYVDFTSKVSVAEHWTPIMYLKNQWNVIASDIDTSSCCTMHRWQWALFQSVEDVNETVIVMNLHGPTQAHGEAMGGKDIFFNEVNAKLKELSSLYPNATITITGDYNERADSTYLSMMIDGVKIQNTCNLTGNQEKSDIDHVFVSEELSSTQQFRVVDNFTVRRCSDHKAVFADILLEKVYVPTPGSAMDWEDGMMIYDINSNTNAIKVLGERHLESNKTLYADWTASGLEFYANMNSQSDIIFTANSTAPCYFKAYVDGTLWQNNGSDYYTVSGATKIVLQSVPAGTHTVRLVKATGYLLGQAEISAVELNGTISATPDNDLYIEFLGDSISCGWGVVGSHDGGYASQDGTLAYPYLVAQALGADYSILGLSGRGVVYGTDYNFDKNYLQASPARSTSAYGFERKADIVVINLGTNERGNHADTAEFEAGYVRLLENVFAKNGSDCIVYCLWGAMNDTYNTQIQSAIATYQASHAGAQIHTLTLARSTVDSGAPSWGHPSISDHAGYTTALTNALKNVIS